MSLIHIINGFCGMLLRFSAVTRIIRLAFGVEYMATTGLLFGTVFYSVVIVSER